MVDVVRFFGIGFFVGLFVAPIDGSKIKVAVGFFAGSWTSSRTFGQAGSLHFSWL